MKNTNSYWLNKCKVVLLCCVLLLVRNMGILAEEQNADHSGLNDVQSNETEDPNQFNEINENTVSDTDQVIPDFIIEEGLERSEEESLTDMDNSLSDENEKTEDSIVSEEIIEELSEIDEESTELSAETDTGVNGNVTDETENDNEDNSDPLQSDEIEKLSSADSEPSDLKIQSIAPFTIDENPILFVTDGYSVSWTSSDPSIVTVDQSGMLSGVKPGKALITARSGSLSDTIEVRVLFSDVTDGSLFYYNYVYEMADRGVITGWNDGTFRPENSCNRASIITFLWRMAGKPEPKNMAAFSDMTDNNDFNKAISWAAENGITTGWNDNTFRPWNTCNRASIVTFLWRYAGKPLPVRTASFKDMTGNTDFDSAISWAVEEGIVTGWNDNTFRPWNTCNRLAAVSFLGRYLFSIPVLPVNMKVALIADYYRDIDNRYNQLIDQSAKSFCEENNIEYRRYEVQDDMNKSRKEAIGQAVSDGYDTLLLSGWSFIDVLYDIVDRYPNVRFAAFDVTQWDIGGLFDTIPDNLYFSEYKTEILGYLAGAAAVNLGYEKLGFLGAMSVPEIMRYGYGFVQGADAAAAKLGKTIEIKFAYANQYFIDSDIDEAMDSWYSQGTEVVFASGGSIVLSAAEAAEKVGGKIICADYDQMDKVLSYLSITDRSICITTAEKKVDVTTTTLLNAIHKGKWKLYGGQQIKYGLVSSTDLSLNHIGLSENTQWNNSFTETEYKKILADIISGKVVVSDEIESTPVVNHAVVDYQGNIK